MPDNINLDKIREALEVISAQGHIIVSNDKKPQYPAKDWQVPSEQLTVDAAIDAYAKWGDSVRGIGAVMGHSRLTLDFDPVEQHHIDAAAKYGISEQEIHHRRNALLERAKATTYVEKSHSRGHHVVVKVSRSFIRRACKLLKTCFAIDVIHGNKYCHITGKRLNDLHPRDATDDLMILFDQVESLCPAKLSHSAAGEIGVDWLPDGVVWQVLSLQRSETFATCGNDGHCDFSETIMKAVGDLAKITSDAGQAYRMLAKTPLVTSRVGCEEDGKRDRREKFEKLFDHWWQGAREHNQAGLPLITRNDTGLLPSIEHGTRVFEQIMACRSALPPAPPAKVPTSDATGRVVESVQTYLMCGASASYLDEDSPAPEHLERLISINTRAMKLPFRKFAAISTIGIFSGLLGRKYKTEDGIAASMLLILGAQSGSGKGEAFRFWPQHVNRLMRGLDPNRNNPIYSGDARSSESLHDIVQGGARVWLREECANQLKLLYGDDPQSTALRDKTNELFDASKPHSIVAPPGSIAARQRKSVEIWNASVALVWSTTDDNLQEIMKVHGLLTGTGSRALFALHEGYTGDSVAIPDDSLSDDAREVLTNALVQMCELDGEYERGGGERADALIVKVPYSAEAAQLKREVEDRLDKLRKAITDGKLPKHHLIFIRAAMLAAKIALISAVVRSLSTKAPASISRDDYERGLGYVLRFCGELVSNIDCGKIDTKLSDSHRVVLHRFNKLLRKTIGKKGEGYVSATELKRSLRYSSAEIERLANQLRAPAARIIDEAIGELMKVEAIRAVDYSPAEGGYKKPHYAAGDEFDATISSIMGQV